MITRTLLLALALLVIVDADTVGRLRNRVEVFDVEGSASHTTSSHTKHHHGGLLAEQQHSSHLPSAHAAVERDLKMKKDSSKYASSKKEYKAAKKGKKSDKSSKSASKSGKGSKGSYSKKKTRQAPDMSMSMGFRQMDFSMSMDFRQMELGSMSMDFRQMEMSMSM